MLLPIVISPSGNPDCNAISVNYNLIRIFIKLSYIAIFSTQQRLEINVTPVRLLRNLQPDLQVVQVGNDLMHGQVRVDFGGLGRSAVLPECPVLVEQRNVENLHSLCSVYLAVHILDPRREIFVACQGVADGITDVETPIGIQEGVDHDQARALRVPAQIDEQPAKE